MVVDNIVEQSKYKKRLVRSSAREAGASSGEDGGNAEESRNPIER